jgi:CBS domain-containing protein
MRELLREIPVVCIATVRAPLRADVRLVPRLACGFPRIRRGQVDGTVKPMTTLLPTLPLASTRVADAMHDGVIVCERDEPLSRVARLMSEHRVHSVVVGGEAGRLWGIVSDLDLVAAAAVRPLEEQTAGGTAVTPVVAVAPEHSLQEAAQLMTEYGVAHLVVVEQHTGRPVGVLSTLDVARTLAA